MNQFNKDIIAALSSDKDITLNEVLRRQIEVAANQFLQNELTAVLGYEPHTRIDRSKDDVNYRNGTHTRILRPVGPFLCPQNQKILSTNHHYGNPSTRFSVEPK